MASMAGKSSSDPEADLERENHPEQAAQPVEPAEEPALEDEAPVSEDPAAGSGGELEAAREQAARNHEQYLRTLAELQNIQRRHERDRAELAKYAAEAVLRDLLPTVDDLERAIDHAGASGAARGEGLVAGVEMVLKGLLAVLEKHGVKRIAALGRPFDPSQHEAVGMAEDTQAAPNTVVAEHRAGYTLGDRLLRPAMVVVAMPKA